MGCPGGKYILIGQIHINLPPGHPIVAIRNNRNQNGRLIGKKVYCRKNIQSRFNWHLNSCVENVQAAQSMRESVYRSFKHGKSK